MSIEEIIYLPEYPDCPITVWYNYQVCWKENKPIINININGFGVIGEKECSKCFKFFSENMDTFEQISAFYARLWEIIPQKLFYAQQASDPQSVDCATGACLTFEAYFTSCIRYAKYDNSDGESSEKKVLQLNCNDLICCMKGKTMCWDSQTKSIVETEFSNTYFSGACEADPPPVPDAVEVSPCQSPCN